MRNVCVCVCACTVVEFSFIARRFGANRGHLCLVLVTNTKRAIVSLFFFSFSLYDIAVEVAERVNPPCLSDTRARTHASTHIYTHPHERTHKTETHTRARTHTHRSVESHTCTRASKRERE